MTLPDKRSLTAIIVVIVATLIAQFPAVSHWIAEVTGEHAHLVTIVEGIIGVVLLFFASNTAAGAAK